MSEQVVVNPEGQKEVRDIKSMSFLEKVRHIESIYIGYPRLEELLKKIEFWQNISKVTADPECAFIGGNTGAGKSTLCEQHMNKYRKQILPKKTLVRVLCLSIPTRATHHNLVEAMLEALGDPCPTKGSTNHKTMRLKKLLRDCGVELIILDELQLFYDEDAHKVLWDTCHWLRGLIVDTKIPVVLMGLPGAETVLNGYEQLSRRFANRHKLSPLVFSVDHNIDELRKFLFALDRKLPFCELSGLDSYDMAFRINYATDGVVGYIMTLVRKAGRIALEAGVEKLDLDILEEAFNLYIQKDKPNKVNPFEYESFTEEDIKKATKLLAHNNPKPYGVGKRSNARKKREKTTKDIF